MVNSFKAEDFPFVTVEWMPPGMVALVERDSCGDLKVKYHLLVDLPPDSRRKSASCRDPQITTD